MLIVAIVCGFQWKRDGSRKRFGVPWRAIATRALCKRGTNKLTGEVSLRLRPTSLARYRRLILPEYLLKFAIGDIARKKSSAIGSIRSLYLDRGQIFEKFSRRLSQKRNVSLSTGQVGRCSVSGTNVSSGTLEAPLTRRPTVSLSARTNPLRILLTAKLLGHSVAICIFKWLRRRRGCLAALASAFRLWNTNYAIMFQH